MQQSAGIEVENWVKIQQLLDIIVAAADAIRHNNQPDRQINIKTNECGWRGRRGTSQATQQSTEHRCETIAFVPAMVSIK
eukprot:scaffold22125_cov97-Cyclotella_meneghiniana.AAC.2